VRVCVRVFTSDDQKKIFAVFFPTNKKKKLPSLSLSERNARKVEKQREKENSFYIHATQTTTY